MKNLKTKKPKHRIVKDSDIGPSPMVHDNAEEDTTENNNETSINDSFASSSNDDREEGHYESTRSNAEFSKERS